jgi:hypothetical protein
MDYAIVYVKLASRHSQLSRTLWADGVFHPRVKLLQKLPNILIFPRSLLPRSLFSDKSLSSQPTIVYVNFFRIKLQFHFNFSTQKVCATYETFSPEITRFAGGVKYFSVNFQNSLRWKYSRWTTSNFFRIKIFSTSSFSRSFVQTKPPNKWGKPNFQIPRIFGGSLKVFVCVKVIRTDRKISLRICGGVRQKTICDANFST